MFKTQVARDYPDYLRDESRRSGSADGIAFPQTEADMIALLRVAAKDHAGVTIQGGRTGISAGAVPEGGCILNLGRFNRFRAVRQTDSGFNLVLQPGVLLSEIRQFLAGQDVDFDWPADADPAVLGRFRQSGRWMFTPDPTETSATIGGMTACNASGARSFAYGPTRRHIDRIRVALADGDLLDLRRGAVRADGRRFRLTTVGGRVMEGMLPAYTMPAVKNAAGYYAMDDMDLVDLFIGSEGTLGILTEIEIRLMPVPGAEWGVMAFFDGEAGALRFVEQVRATPDRLVALEFFDAHALDLLRAQKRDNPAFHAIPDMDPAWHTAVYVEFHGATDDQLETALMNVMERLEPYGGSESATWTAANEREMEPLKFFRHAIPESVNLCIDQRRKQEPKLTKLGTDLSVPDARLADIFRLYHESLDSAGLEYVIFGHVGNNHVHVNILPRNLDDYQRGRALYLGWADRVVAMGGSVSAEHGIGKLKCALLERMFGTAGIEQMRAVKRLLDPEGRLNRGSLFAWNL
ncbi:MAG: hypothetical protein A2498_10275 [Lentisphaerae bacterium RIFOXYC12_FULL_60_16]|nr:MAG: hypothetical protein A2498_10275 [Lentisphaerae bacterium RIFOXYC12_FULL_60_16]